MEGWDVHMMVNKKKHFLYIFHPHDFFPFPPNSYIIIISGVSLHKDWNISQLLNLTCYTHLPQHHNPLIKSKQMAVRGPTGGSRPLITGFYWNPWAIAF